MAPFDSEVGVDRPFLAGPRQDGPLQLPGVRLTHNSVVVSSKHLGPPEVEPRRAGPLELQNARGVLR